MTSALEPHSASTQKQGWQRTVRVPVAVTDATAEEKDDMIEQRPVAIRRIPQLFQIFPEQHKMMPLNAGTLLHLCRVVLMVRHRMMRLGGSNLRIRSAGLLTTIHESNNPGQVRLVCQQLQVIQQPDVLLEHVRNTGGLGDV